MSRYIVLDAGITGLSSAGSPPEPRGPDLDKLRKEIAAETQAASAAQFERLRLEQGERCRRCGRQFDDFLEKMKADIADEVIGFSVRLAEILVRHELPDRDMLCNLIRETLDPVSDLQGAKVRMNPKDVEAVQRARNDSAAPAIVSDRVEIVPDPSLAVGDMLIESRNGLFDARLGQRLVLLEERLRERRRRSHANGH